MSREIKFIAWDNDLQKMSKPFKFNQVLNFCDEKGLGSIKSLTTEHVVMQCTGLKDRNGKEIYADDLIKTDKDLLFRIYHTAGGFAMKQSVWAKNLMNEVNTDILIFQPLVDAQTISYIRESCEVVGNIYENTELLKEQ